MSIKDRIEKDYTAALKERNAPLVSTLRMLRAAVKNGEIDKMKKFEDPEVEAVLRTEVKKLRETLQIATDAGRGETAEQAKGELEMIAAYLPEQLDEASVRAIVADKLKSLGTVTDKDFGRVTGEVMKEIKGKADGGLVSRIIKEMLAVKT